MSDENIMLEEKQDPLVVDLSNLAIDGEEVVKMSKFQHIDIGFFAQTKEATLSVNGRNVSVNAAAVRLFPEVDYMEILIDPVDKQVIFQPTDEYNFRAYRWATTKNGKRYSTKRTGLPFTLCVCEMMGWNFNKRYKVLGKRVPSDTGGDILLFDLMSGHGYDKPGPGEKGRSTILTGWNGTFGPAYGTAGGSVQMVKIDKFAAFSLKEGWMQDEDVSSTERAEEKDEQDHSTN